jgi:hypothetical protein
VRQACSSAAFAEQALLNGFVAKSLLSFKREQTGDSITVRFVDPIAFMKLADKPGVAQIAGEVRATLDRLRDPPCQNRQASTSLQFQR